MKFCASTDTDLGVVPARQILYPKKSVSTIIFSAGGAITFQVPKKFKKKNVRPDLKNAIKPSNKFPSSG